MADDDPARRQQVLDHPRLGGQRTESQTACSMTPANDFREEPVAAINGCRTRDHRARIADVRRQVVNLTGPATENAPSASVARRVMAAMSVSLMQKHVEMRAGHPPLCSAFDKTVDAAVMAGDLFECRGKIVHVGPKDRRDNI